MTGRVVAPTSKGAHMPTQLEFMAKGWEEGRGEGGDDGGDTCSYRMWGQGGWWVIGHGGGEENIMIF